MIFMRGDKPGNIIEALQVSGSDIESDTFSCRVHALELCLVVKDYFLKLELVLKSIVVGILRVLLQHNCLPRRVLSKPSYRLFANAQEVYLFHTL